MYIVAFLINSQVTANNELDHFDISEELDQELQDGNLHLDLSDIGWPGDIQDGLSDLSTALDTLFVLYLVGIAAAGLNILTVAAALFLHSSRLGPFGNLGLASLSFLSLLIASIIITIVQVKAVDLINTNGNNIGVYVYRGDKYLALTWVAVVVMFLAVVEIIPLLRERIGRWNILKVRVTVPSPLDLKTEQVTF